MFEELKKIDPEVYEAVTNETKRENGNIELIASENFTSVAVLEAQGSTMTNKYAEGYPDARWYGGCEYVDVVEKLAIDRAKKLFGSEHVNVQPHSGTTANMAVYYSVLKVGDTILAMDLACGGHLSHGHKHNFSGKYFTIVPYGVDKKTETIDYDEIREKARAHKPKLILAGASAYPRTLDFNKFREICDEVGAYLMVDIAHIAGLVATGLHPTPVPVSEFVTSTTHKTLRGPRSGFVMCRKEFAKGIDMAVFPGLQGGPLMHVVAAKAVAFKEALLPEFKKYQEQVIKNAKALAEALEAKTYRIVSGGTDNHLMLVDLTNKGVSGKDATAALDKAAITVNKNLIPFDTAKPTVTSGIRLGTPAMTTRGMKEKEMKNIAELIDKVVANISDGKIIESVKNEVKEMLKAFPLYKV
ncbi:MAG: serine hydroxymethyltransferase [Candidatus Omnitrophica bacterium]|nr:serine hydroxymethyltransferase [Candidatus Omnitrophota bacterium]MBU4487732.1 serine hydroxymethyltransferase [Candidatus Omnitrophota bacterium]MCG2705272.1 serine hydroxymethyltransferase [Candidatus Omnitrophota bacterium]